MTVSEREGPTHQLLRTRYLYVLSLYAHAFFKLLSCLRTSSLLCSTEDSEEKISNHNLSDFDGSKHIQLFRESVVP